MKSLQRLWPWLRPYRTSLVIGLFWVIITNGLILMTPQLLRWGITAIEQGNWADVQFYAATMIVVTLLGGGIRVISRLHFLHTGRKV